MTEGLNIDRIRTAFEQMQTKEDLLNLLNTVKPIIYGPNTVLFELKQITWYSNPRFCKKRYLEFSIKKKSGANRSIHAPVKGLKAIQKVLALILQCVFEPHKSAMGFAKGKSIYDNAAIHVGNNYVYNVDLKDFFSSIDQARVWKCLQLKPFNLIDSSLSLQSEQLSTVKTGVRKFETEFGEQIFYKIRNKSFTLINDKKGNYKKYKQRLTGHISVPTLDPLSPNINNLEKLNEYKDQVNNIIDEDAKKYIFSLNNLNQLNKLTSSRLNLANIIATLCCTEMNVERKNEEGVWEVTQCNALPQGAPTSPIITNIVCQRLDHLLSGVSKRFGLKYSRYADDITFSSMHNIYHPDSEFQKELSRIIAEQGFRINDSKTRLQKSGYRQEVTGLLVNEKVNVQQRYIKQLRMWLYYWERYGYDKANIFFFQQYIEDKGHVKVRKPELANVISGKLNYLKMVKGDKNKLLLNLVKRFISLTAASQLPNLMVRPAKESEPARLPFPFIHKPQELISLLKKFSLNDKALKYTTHSWDIGRDSNLFKDLSEFLSKAKEEYNAFSYYLYSLSSYLHGKINNFLFNSEIAKEGWGDSDPQKRIYFGWSSPELLEACKLDASLNPEDFILPEKYQTKKDGKTIQKFKHVIDIFKNEIEIRDENSALLNLILQKHDTFLFNFEDPIISNLENKTFYTDVQWFSKALDMIFGNIQNRPEHKQVSYSIKDEKKDSYTLEITHLNSFNTGKSIHDEKLQLTKGHFGDIYKALKNLCDWSIESKFAEGCYRLNYLSSNPDIPPNEKIEEVRGFKHILTFYK